MKSQTLSGKQNELRYLLDEQTLPCLAHFALKIIYFIQSVYVVNK